MAENSTLARPYAQAVFELAQSQKALAKWSDALRVLAAVTADPRMQGAIGNPKLTRAQLASLVIDVCGKSLDAHGQNFVKLLIENGRLRLVPEITALYEELRAEAESTLAAEVISATTLTADQQAKIAGALKKRLGRDVTVTTKQDASLLGGAIIRAGDLVIDGSVRGQLEKLGTALQG